METIWALRCSTPRSSASNPKTNIKKPVQIRITKSPIRLLANQFHITVEATKSGGLCGIPLSTNTNVRAADKPPNYALPPPFVKTFARRSYYLCLKYSCFIFFIILSAANLPVSIDIGTPAGLYAHCPA